MIDPCRSRVSIWLYIAGACTSFVTIVTGTILKTATASGSGKSLASQQVATTTTGTPDAIQLAAAATGATTVAAATAPPTAAASATNAATPAIYLFTQIPITFIAWIALGTFLGAIANTLVAGPQINNLLFYRRILSSIMGGISLTPMLILLLALFVQLKAEPSKQAILIYTLTHPVIALGLSFIISMLFWTVTSWYQEHNNRVLDKLAGMEPPASGSTTNNKTIIVVTESIEDATNVIRTMEGPQNGRN